MGMIADFVFSFLGEALIPGPGAGTDPLDVNACSLRVIAGRQEGLGDSWSDGQATVYPGGLDFEASFHVRDGLRAALITAPPISVPVRAVVTARQRRPNDKETGKVKADSQIVELTTETATLEWAVPADRLEWALKRVQASWPSAVSPA